MGTRISSGARHSQEVPFSLHSGEMSSLGETEDFIRHPAVRRPVLPPWSQWRPREEQ